MSDNLLEFRKCENISQEEIAFRTEISKYTISLIERQRTNVTLEIMEKLASYTGLTIPELLTEDFVKNSHRKLSTK